MSEPTPKQQYIDHVAGPLVLNTWLTVSCVFLGVLVLGEGVAIVHLSSVQANLKPLVIRIDELGRAEAVNYDAATYAPKPIELRHYLTEWAEKHFGRRRATVARDYPESLMFMTADLGSNLASTKQVQEFIRNGSGDEVEVNVKRVVLSDLTAAPFRGEITYELRPVGQGFGTENTAHTFTAQVVFSTLDRVPSRIGKVNPIGLQISDVRLTPSFD